MAQVKELRGEHTFTIPIAGQATAGTADEFTGFVAPFNAKIVAVKWIPKAAVTASGTHYFAMTVRNRTTGAGTAVAATRSYVATDSVALTPEAVTLSSTAADLNLAAGDLVTVEKLNTGNGLAMPAGTVQISIQGR